MYPNTVFLVLVRPSKTFVKSYHYFKREGGMEAEWGKRWKPVFASSIEDARVKGTELYGKKK